MSATVLLARHGRHDEVGTILSGRSDIALNAAGRGEARRLAAHLAGVQLAAVYASPQRRARETAAAVDVPVVLDGLDEIDFGRWTGRSFAALAADPAWQAWNHDRGIAATPGGETMASVAARALAAIDGALRPGVALFVSHCDVIRAVVAAVIGLPLSRVFAFDVDCGGLTTLVRDGGAFRLVTLNERP